MKPQFKLGDKVTINGVLEKVDSYDKQYHLRRTGFATKAINPVEGIYIGYRTAVTGTVRYGEDGPDFKGTGKVAYLLVVTHPRQNPVRVHPDFIVLT